MTWNDGSIYCRVYIKITKQFDFLPCGCFDWKVAKWVAPRNASFSFFFSFCFLVFLELKTQITEGQYLWQAPEFNVLSEWDSGLNGPSCALKAMRSAHHFGPNKGYHHVVAFLTIAHRNPLIKWALCGTPYKRACYTIVGSKNNTRRGQLSKRSQSHREGWAKRREGGCQHQGLCGKLWHQVKGGGGTAGRRHSGMNGRQKSNSSQKQLSMTSRGQTTGRILCSHQTGAGAGRTSCSCFHPENCELWHENMIPKHSIY